MDAKPVLGIYGNLPAEGGDAPSDVGGDIAIIGAGWFGCTIATELLRWGLSVRIFEAKSQVFGGASGHNQHRLHLGFHYPRSHKTREQTRLGFDWFMQRYPHFSAKVPQNAYAIGDEKSLLDFPTYLQIMQAAGLTFEMQSPDAFDLKEVEGCITCGERRVRTNFARQWFQESLQDQLYLNCPVTDVREVPGGVEVNGDRFDLVVNCSNQTFMSHPGWSIIHEPCATLIYEGEKDHPAITVLDGPFFTIYPYHDNLFSVYSVTHTRKGKFRDCAEAQRVLDSLDAGEIDRTRQTIESEIDRHYPTFRERFQFVEAHRSIRSILTDRSDARPCIVSTGSRIISVMAGKIDAVFFAVDRVKACVKQYCSPGRAAESAQSSAASSRSA